MGKGKPKTHTWLCNGSGWAGWWLPRAARSARRSREATIIIVTIEELRKFIAAYPERIDHRKVDFPWLVWVLVTKNLIRKGEHPRCN